MSVWATLQARKRLFSAFKTGDICRKVGGHMLYPAIKRVELADKYTRYTVKLPAGLDPSILTDKLYVFQQILGPHVVIDGDIRYFTITVYRKGLPSKVAYKFTDWQTLADRMALPVIVGRDHNNEPVAFDLAEYPHVLISGETGSGKSSLLRAVLTTLMLGKKPTDVRFILGDLKRSEFGLYRRMPHVEGVHITASTLLPALRLIDAEMKRRGSLLDKHEVTHVSELSEKLPYYVVAIDEVALLRKEKEVMAIIEDISSIGRSLGVLLMLSMQRPDAEVLNGRLKNNLTVRISGRQSNKRNAGVAGVEGSETIKISDKGRMIFVLDEPVEVQTPWLTFDDAKRLLAPLKTEPVVELTPAEPAHEFQFGMLDGGEP